MVNKIQWEYGVGQDRAIQVPDRVRKLVANPDIKALKEAGLLEEEFTSDLVRDLITLLDNQDEETIEGRWNSLAKERGVYDVVGVDALLYNPGKAGLDTEYEMVSDDGESITIQEAMITAWSEEIPIEAIPQGIRLGYTEFRIENSRQMTLFQQGVEFDEDDLIDQLSRDLRRSRLEVDSDLLALKDIDFPIKSRHQDCVIAISGARRCILDRDGASRERILEELKPEINYPVGINGFEARANASGYEFRQRWWDEVVAPGLRSLPDITEPDQETGQWLSIE